jgi:hypothetical protein
MEPMMEQVAQSRKNGSQEKPISRRNKNRSKSAPGKADVTLKELQPEVYSIQAHRVLNSDRDYKISIFYQRVYLKYGHLKITISIENWSGQPSIPETG